MQDLLDKRPLVLVLARNDGPAARRCAELSLAGCRTVHVEDLIEAMSLIRSHGVQAALVLPPLAEAAEADLPAILREVEPALYLPVLVQVDRGSAHLRCQCLKQGADGVVSPETCGEELAARIESLLRAKELHDQLAASRAALQRSLQRERKLLARLRSDNATLQALAATDPLTHTQNVRSFTNLLDHEYAIARRYGQPLSLLMLDVDHFKMVNDRCGHPAGDFVLKELAVILKRSVRDSDVVARTGGEEFSIILPRADLRRGAVLAARVRREVAGHSFACYGQDIRVTISVGACTYPADAEVTQPGMLTYFADQALLAAKQGGRDRVVAVHELAMEVRRRLRRQYIEAHRPTEDMPCSLTPTPEPDVPSSI